VKMMMKFGFGLRARRLAEDDGLELALEFEASAAWISSVAGERLAGRSSVVAFDFEGSSPPIASKQISAVHSEVLTGITGFRESRSHLGWPSRWDELRYQMRQRAIV
jgi:hypothetical protein